MSPALTQCYHHWMSQPTMSGKSWPRAVVSPQYNLHTEGGSLTAILQQLTSCSQPVNHDPWPSVQIWPLLNTLLHHHKQVCWYVPACDKWNGMGMGVADTFSMMTSSSGINRVAQQLCVKPLMTLMSLAFPQLKRRGSVSYQAMPCIALTHPFCKHSNTKLAFIISCNTSYTFLARCHTAVDV